MESLMYASATVVEMFDKIKVQDIYCKVIYIYRQKMVNRQTRNFSSWLFTIRLICYKISDILCLNLLTRKNCIVFSITVQNSVDQCLKRQRYIYFLKRRECQTLHVRGLVGDFPELFFLLTQVDTSSRPALHAWFTQAAADSGLFPPR